MEHKSGSPLNAGDIAQLHANTKDSHQQIGTGNPVLDLGVDAARATAELAAKAAVTVFKRK